MKNIFTTAYNPKFNCETERFNRTIDSALRNYVADHQRDCDLYSDTVTYAYNAKVHSSAEIAPFDLI